MKILRDPLGRDEPPAGAVLSIGNFDGVHRGHRTVLEHVVQRARDAGATAAVMTLDPHPVKLLRPALAPRLLTTLDQRLALIERTGIDVTLVLPFTHRVARIEAEDFVRRVLVGRLRVREVYIGANFRFGADRRGDVDLLERMGESLGFRAAAWPTVLVDGEPVSSTRVRAAVASGEVEVAARLLGRPTFVDGVVVEGRRVGRRIGFPTLNIDVDNELLPANGVYVTATHIEGDPHPHPSVTNVGLRPTLTEAQVLTVESHVFDFDDTVYGWRARVAFLSHLRGEQSFPSIDELRAQIDRDAGAARAWFDDHPLDTLELIAP